MEGEDKALHEIEMKLKASQEELLKKANARDSYDHLADEINRLSEDKKKAQSEIAEGESIKQRISEMEEFLSEQKEAVMEYDENLVRRLIEKVTVYADRVTVDFKSGTSVDVRR